MAFAGSRTHLSTRNPSHFQADYPASRRYALVVLLLSGLFSGVFWLAVINATIVKTGFYFNSAFLLFAMMTFGTIMCIVRISSKDHA